MLNLILLISVIATILFGLIAVLLLSRTRRFAIGIACALLSIFFLLADIKLFQFHTMFSTPPPMPVTTVTSAEVKKADWQPRLTAIGSVSAVEGATISAELAGTVQEINFQSGAPVKKGEILLQLDASSDEAQLRSAVADAELAKNDLDRAKGLSDRKVISQAELDAAQFKYDQKKGVVDNMKSIIDKKHIRAPFDGVAGIRAVNPGTMVKVGDPLVSLQGLDKVFVDFSLPQQDLAKVKGGLPVEVTSDAVPGRDFQGTLTAVNSSVDASTRNVSLQATLDNPDHVLRAGMFARVSVLLPEKNPTLFIPQTAVAYAPYGNSVYIIEKKKDEKTKQDELTLRQQFVRTGETRGDFVAVTDGLKANEKIVSTGVFKLRNGMNVVIDNKLAPKNELAPKPADS